MATGWVSIYRDLQDHWLWEEKPFSRGQAWIDLILLANRQDGKTPYKGRIIETEAGSIYRSLSWLAERWGWSRHKVRSFIETLESDGMVTTIVTRNQTVITLVNYGKFQGEEGRRGHQTRQRKGNAGTTEGQRGDIYNKDNKENNVNKINARRPVGASAEDEEHLRRLAR